jgi:hypothetical protein
MCQSKNDMGTAVAAFYKDVVDNIRFAKQQQWRVTNYVSLVYAALFALNLQLDDPTWFEMTGLTFLTAAAMILGAYVLWSLMNWLRRLEERLNAIYRTYFSKEEQKNLSINPDRPRTRHDLVSVTFIGIIILGAAAVLYFIWDYPLNPDDVVLTALTAPCML